jgi:hypothetical protein
MYIYIYVTYMCVCMHACKYVGMCVEGGGACIYTFYRARQVSSDPGPQEANRADGGGLCQGASFV